MLLPRYRALFLLLAVLTSFLATSNGCSDKKQGPLTIALDWKPEPEFGGFYQANLAGEFTKQGISVEIREGGSGSVPNWKLVDQGQVDFATTSADLLIQARAAGADVVAVFAVYQTSPQGIMVHKSRGFKAIGDVFTNTGSLGAESNSWLDYLLAKYPQHSVQITADPNGVGVFLAKNDYSQQCFITSEPILANRQGGDAQTFLVADEGFNPYVTVLIASGKTVREKPELVKKVVAGSRAGWRAYLDDPTAANMEMGKLNKEMDAPTFTDAAAAQKPLIETDDTRRDGLGAMKLERWQALIKQLSDLKPKDKFPKAEECFVNLK